MRCPHSCLLCYSNRRGRSNYRGHWGYRKPARFLKEDVVVAINRRVVVASADGGDDSYGPDELSQLFPHVVEFLVETRYGDGSNRLPGSLSFFTEDGMLKACLNDKDQGLIVFVSGSGLQGCLLALERGLQQDSLEWRKAKDRGGKRRK